MYNVQLPSSAPTVTWCASSSERASPCINYHTKDLTKRIWYSVVIESYRKSRQGTRYLLHTGWVELFQIAPLYKLIVRIQPTFVENAGRRWKHFLCLKCTPEVMCVVGSGDSAALPYNQHQARNESAPKSF